nr:FIST N-terminal domain-containing protein [uncultured Psychroserpens sp.]
MLITTTHIDDIVASISNHIKEDSALLSIGEHTEIDIEQLIKALNIAEVKFIGGLFPKVIHGNTILEKGIVVNTLNHVEELYVVNNISLQNYTIPQINFEKDEGYSLFTYVDGLTSNISHYLSELYENYGMQTNYFGGGAGSLTLEQKPCVICNEGFFQDAAVVCVMRMHSRIGVRHGWSKVKGPFIVTKAEGNVIKEINWKNPFEVYKKVVEAHSNKVFTDDNFFDIAKGYPFGIVKDNAECIVRDPLMVNDKGELICVGELEDNTLVDILNGNEETLINAAQRAAEESVNQATHPRKAIIIDCISRILFLEDNFEKELDAITKTISNAYPNISIGGALTLGEISSYGEGYLDFYNKTVVVGLFE